MATPLFRPTIEAAIAQFTAERAHSLTRTVQLQYQDVLDALKRFLNQEGVEGLPEEQRVRWEALPPPRPPFVQYFQTPRILAQIPPFMQDLLIQQAVLPDGMVTNAEKVMQAFGRWLLERELVTERDYLGAIEALPHYASQLDPAEQLSSLLFDFSQDEPPTGKVFGESRGYHEIIRVMRGTLVLLPVSHAGASPQVKVPPEASALARAGWWIDTHLIHSAAGWLFIDVGNVLP